MDKFRKHFSPVTAQMVEALEEHIARLEQEIDIPPAFIVPGATPSSAAFDLARTIARRAERRVVELKQDRLIENPQIIRYLNRLSDLLYELARYETKGSAQEVKVGGKS
jgi:cob(I)alamin adenosyltransferase